MSGIREKELLVDEIATLKNRGGRVTVKTLFGEEKEIEGSIREIDFMNGSIILENSKADK
jgi:predicted RNA-binding protein